MCGDAHHVAIDSEQGRILVEEAAEAGLGASGDLPHLLAEALGAELTAQIVEAALAAFAVVNHQLLEEEHQSQIAVCLVIVRLHDGG